MRSCKYFGDATRWQHGEMTSCRLFVDGTCGLRMKMLTSSSEVGVAHVVKQKFTFENIFMTSIDFIRQIANVCSLNSIRPSQVYSLSVDDITLQSGHNKDSWWVFWVSPSLSPGLLSARWRMRLKWKSWKIIKRFNVNMNLNVMRCEGTS